MGNICVCVNPIKKSGVLKFNTTNNKIDVAVVRYDKNNMKRINQYLVLKDFGICSFGTVSLVMDDEQKQYAMRTGQRRFLASTVDLASELATLRGLNHPNVLHLHEVIDDCRNPEVFLVFEYSEGGPLMRLDTTGVASSGALSEADVRKFVPQIFDGLMHLHKHGVVHGDLHPGNILLCRNRMNIKLSDFRVAQLFQPPLPMGANLVFLAPELCHNTSIDCCNGFLCDIWALGVTMYTMLWGYVPWKPVTDIVTLHNAIQYQVIVYPNADQFEESLLLLLSRMLERDAMHRITLSDACTTSWLVSISPKHRAELSEDLALLHDTRKVRVLIVEDVALVRKTLVRMFVSILKDPDLVEVNTVECEAEALQECKRKKYRLILMDVHKSRVTWSEVTESIRQFEKEKCLPRCNIVGFTADNHEEVANGCLRAGMNTVVCKPLVVSTLRELCIAYGIEVNSSKSSAWSDGDANTLLASYDMVMRHTDPPLHEVQGSIRSSPGTATHSDPDPRKRSTSSKRVQIDDIESVSTLPLTSCDLTTQGATSSGPQAGRDPKKESQAWMHRTRKGRRTPFNFTQVAMTACFPWALGTALREVQAVDLSLDATQSTKLHNLISDLCRGDSIQPNDEKQVRLDTLNTVVKEQVAPVLQEFSQQPSKPRLEVYAHGDQGVRGTMEDMWCVVENLRSFCGKPLLPGQADDMFVGLYDGHTGKEAAEFARDHLHYYLAHHPSFEVDLRSAISGCFHETDEQFISCAPESDAGTTATAIIIRDSQLYIGNAGDARVVLCHAGKPVVLNKVHRPEDSEESEMVQKRGGAVYFYNGAWRVNATLSVSRSLGDPAFRNYITCEPEVVVRDISAEDEFLVVGSDGLWDHMSPQEVVDFVRQCRIEVDDARANKDADAAASDTGSMDNYRIVTAALVDAALQCGSTDNVSCAIVYLQRPSDT